MMNTSSRGDLLRADADRGHAEPGEVEHEHRAEHAREEDRRVRHVDLIPVREGSPCTAAAAADTRSVSAKRKEVALGCFKAMRAPFAL